MAKTSMPSSERATLRIKAIFAALFALAGCENLQISSGGKTYDLGKAVRATQGLSKAFYISPESERQIGRDAAASLVGQLGMYDDESVTKYVNLVGLALARKAQRKDVRWRFAVLNSKAVNAFSTPGGYVFITKGLFKLCKDEAELAGVLAHEIEHVDRNHGINAVKLKFAADGITELTEKNSKLVTEILAGIFQNGYSRDKELEADKYGVLLAANVGYDPKGLPRALKAQHESAGQDVKKNASFNKRHPAFADRIRALSALDVPDSGATLKKRFLANSDI